MDNAVPWTEPDEPIAQNIQSTIGEQVVEQPKSYINFDYLRNTNTLGVILGPNEGTTDLIVREAEYKLQKIRADIVAEGKTKALKVTGRMPVAVASTITANLVNVVPALVFYDPKVGYIVTTNRGYALEVGSVTAESIEDL